MSTQPRTARAAPSTASLGRALGGGIALPYSFAMTDLFASSQASGGDYDASSIEVLEGLEPVRRRPGMYIGGTDERALHHLAAEGLDNSMDEAGRGRATRIEVTLSAEAGTAGRLAVTDN